MSSDLRIATIRITRDLTDDADIINVEAYDAQNDTLPLVEALGMLRFAEDTVIRAAMGETGE